MYLSNLLHIFVRAVILIPPKMDHLKMYPPNMQPTIMQPSKARPIQMYQPQIVPTSNSTHLKQYPSQRVPTPKQQSPQIVTTPNSTYIKQYQPQIVPTANSTHLKLLSTQRSLKVSQLWDGQSSRDDIDCNVHCILYFVFIFIREHSSLLCVAFKMQRWLALNKQSLVYQFSMKGQHK